MLLILATTILEVAYGAADTVAVMRVASRAASYLCIATIGKVVATVYQFCNFLRMVASLVSGSSPSGMDNLSNELAIPVGVHG